MTQHFYKCELRAQPAFFISNIINGYRVFSATSILDVASQQFVAQVQTLWAADMLWKEVKQVTVSAQESLSELPQFHVM